MSPSGDIKSSFIFGIVKISDMLLIYPDLLTAKMIYVVPVMVVILLKLLSVYLLVKINLTKCPRC